MTFFAIRSGKIYSVLLFLLLFCIVSIHYLMWVKVVVPLPVRDGAMEFYYPALNYLHIAGKVGNDLNFIRTKTGCYFEYSYGLSLLLWFVVECGLREAIIANPFLLNLFCIIPFALSMFCFKGREKGFFAGLIICFSPLAQICIKQFELHGLAISCAFIAILLFRSWLICKSRYLIPGFMFLLWFGSLLKISSMLLALNLIFVYVFWSVINRCFSEKILLMVLLPVLMAIPFYNYNFLCVYIASSLRHNNYIASHFTIGVLIFALCILILIVISIMAIIYLKSQNQNLPPAPKIFCCKKRFFLLLFCLFGSIFASISFPPLILGLFCYGAFWPFLCRYNFRGVRGFIYLYIFLTLIPMLMLYSSGIGRTNYVVFCSLFLMLVQLISENDSRIFRSFLLFLILLLSNFFPSFKKIDEFIEYFDSQAYMHIFQINLFKTYPILKKYSRGQLFYTVLFNSYYQNPLGWQNYGFGQLKKEIIDELSKYSFPQESLLIVSNFGQLFDNQFNFHTNVVYKFPKLHFLSNFSSKTPEIAKKFYDVYAVKGNNYFDELFSSGQIPILLYSEILMKKPFKPVLMNEFIKQNEISPELYHRDHFATAFNDSLINYFKSSGRVENDYVCRSIKTTGYITNLCIDKRFVLSESQNVYDHGKKRLNKIIETRVYDLLFEIMRDIYSNKPLKARRKILIVLEMMPESEKIQSDTDKVIQIWEKAYNASIQN